MNQQNLDRLEADAAEILGTLKVLFKEFEGQLGEIVSAQRLSASEARAEGTRATKDLHDLAMSARAVVNEQRELVARLQREWQLRVDDTAKRAGEAQAQAFGAKIAQGLQEQLADVVADVRRATRRFAWKSVAQWALGIAIAIPLTVGVCLSVMSPRAETLEQPAVEKSTVGKLRVALPGVVGLTAAQTRAAASKLSLCQVAQTADWHTCIEVDNPPRVGLGSVDKPRVVVRGM